MNFSLKIFILNIFVFFFLIFLPNEINADFSEEVSFSIKNLKNSASSWGDYDNDGDWDLAVCGKDSLDNLHTILYENLYKNDDSDILQKTNKEFKELAFGDLAWGDYNNDGWLDLAISGEDSGKDTKRWTIIYRNDHGNFEISQTLDGVKDSALAWGDYNNDGWLDLAVLGMGEGEKLGLLFKNVQGILKNSGITLENVASGDFVWADLNNNGWLDLVQMGKNTNDKAVTVIFKNNRGEFTKDTSTIRGLGLGSLGACDYNNDGWIDITISGETPFSGGQYTEIYTNNGTGNYTFTSSTFSLPQLTNSEIAWGDADNDGDMDLAVLGNDGNSPRTLISSAPYFSDYYDLGSGIELGSIRWGDYDGDDDIDLFMTGENSSGDPISRLMKNDTADDGNPNNIPPKVPQGKDYFNSRYYNNKFYIMWNDPPVDSNEETPTDGFIYNFRVGSSSGTSDIVPARYGSPLLGNYLTKATSGTISDSDIGSDVDVSGYKNVRVLNVTGSNYYWAVQTIDSSLGYSWTDFYGEGWSEQQSFEDDTGPTGKPSIPTDDGLATYNNKLIFNWAKGTASDPETGIFGCYIQIKEVDEDGDKKIVIDKELNRSLANDGIWESDDSAEYRYDKGQLYHTYYVRVKARHGYAQSIPTSTYRPDIYGTPGDPDGLWNPESPHYTGWTDWSDGIQILKLLTINNNLMRRPGDKSDAVEIGYDIIKDSRVKLRIFNIMGELVKTVFDEYVINGNEEPVKWCGKTDNSDIVASGIYYVNIQAAGEEDTEKVVVVR